MEHLDDVKHNAANDEDDPDVAEYKVAFYIH